MHLVHKIKNRFVFAFNGIVIATKTDHAIRTSLFYGAGLLAFGYLMRPLSDTESLFLLLSWFLIFITELQNSAMEVALDRLHPERNKEVGKSKDIAAASVLSALVFSAIVIGMIILARI